MIIQNLRPCLENIEAVTVCRYQSITGDLENVWQDADDHVGLLFKVI